MSYYVILSTAPNINEAKKIAGILVEKKLAACVNIVPKIISVYSWKEEIVNDEEVLMVIKTKESLYNKVEKTINENHSYDIPEVIAMEIEEGSVEYLDWINNETI